MHAPGEKQPDSDGIDVDLDFFKALAKGFLGSAVPLPRHEVEWMADAARIMALELGVRFLTDYLRGDTYFKLGIGDPVDLNRIRADVQFSIFQSMGSRMTEAKNFINDLYLAGGKTLHK